MLGSVFPPGLGRPALPPFALGEDGKGWHGGKCLDAKAGRSYGRAKQRIHCRDRFALFASWRNMARKRS